MKLLIIFTMSTVSMASAFADASTPMTCWTIESQGYNSTTGQYAKQVRSELTAIPLVPTNSVTTITPALVTNASIELYSAYGTMGNQPRLELHAAISDKISGFKVDGDSLIPVGSTANDTIMSLVFRYPNNDAVDVECAPSKLN